MIGKGSRRAGVRMKSGFSRFLRSTGRQGALIGVGLVGGVGGAFAVAAIPNSSGLITACYNTTDAELGPTPLEVVDEENQLECPDGWSPLRWNAAGPRGAEGPAGPPGTPGPIGPAGQSDQRSQLQDSGLSLKDVGLADRRPKATTSKPRTLEAIVIVTGKIPGGPGGIACIKPANDPSGFFADCSKRKALKCPQAYPEILEGSFRRYGVKNSGVAGWDREIYNSGSYQYEAILNYETYAWATDTAKAVLSKESATLRVTCAKTKKK